DLEKIDLAGPVLLADRGERRHRHSAGAELGAEFFRAARVLDGNGGESGEPLDEVEIDLAGRASEEFRHRDIARAHEGIELDQLALRLDHDPAPALQIEPA